MKVSFILNGLPTEAEAPPTRTLLDWLRETRGLTGTKEGCNEGDCGACTVIVTDADGAKTLNACILFLPQVAGKAVRTVEGVAGPDGTLHPVQRAMVEHHGSQCGFCTPGFVTAMACAHLNGARDHDDQLAGNLCRCTGYAPIIRAAEAAAEMPVPDWIRDFQHGSPNLQENVVSDSAAVQPSPDSSDVRSGWGRTDATPGTGAGHAGDTGESQVAVRPETTDDLAAWYADNPEATLIAGATDVGLWVTKGLRDLGAVAFLNGIGDLRHIEDRGDHLWIGAGVTLNALREAMAERHPSFAELIRRYGSVQVRNAATIGGNIANGSPIGDGPPALIALGATLHLRHGDARRSLPLEDFFLDYGKQDRVKGEFVEGIAVPRQDDTLRCYKLSKRFDQDISAVCGCFNIVTEDRIVQSARIAFGGMAGVPKRAAKAEAALVGAALDDAALADAQKALVDDFTPLSDMRASASYRIDAAQGLLARWAAEMAGHPNDVLKLRA